MGDPHGSLNAVKTGHRVPIPESSMARRDDFLAVWVVALSLLEVGTGRSVHDRCPAP